MIIISRILIIVFVALVLLTCSHTPYQYKQVLTIAPAVKLPLLPVTTHIRHAQRPTDPANYPIKLGETGPNHPLFSGDLNYPFACNTLSSGLGQPLVDNQELLGTPVFKLDENGNLTEKVIGFSKDCQLKSKLRYFTIDAKNKISEIFSPQEYDDSKTLLRVEQGTINRYIYAIVMPIELTEWHNRSSKSKWNKRLIYQLAGGVGIGFRQGTVSPVKLISRRTDQLRSGYAVITSGANKTSFSYNIIQAEDAARRVKKQFISLYGDPLYTLGIGGSGGGLAQYLLAQNAPGLIDGALPLYSYPDMISQTLYALDCDLLNSYYTFKSSVKEWDISEKKLAVEGFNNANIEHKSWFYYPINQLIHGKRPYTPKNYSECIHGYFGLSSLINNPDQSFIKNIYSPQVIRQAHWSYWQDLQAVLGSDESGYANSIWDNQGVQYGLLALKQKIITPQEFIHLNYNIGGWKSQSEMKREQLLYFPFVKIPIWLSQWSHHNVYKAKTAPAKRSIGSTTAIKNAYKYGQIYIGYNDIPTIDIHHYLEPKLDMHHISTSFATRARIMSHNNNIDNHKIWIAHPDHTPLEQAFKVMDNWLLNGDSYELKNETSDRCFDAKGNVIAKGETVWDDNWNNKKTGRCAEEYKIYTNSRIQAGGPWLGSIFQCHKISIEKALELKLYGTIDMTVHIKELEEIYPEGVCDHRYNDSARPKNLVYQTN